ncbi:MAG TPA: RDD family protein [Thermohalobaculum sp.]|nr:RDD family protein [Thermohalobaculum sp.]
MSEYDTYRTGAPPSAEFDREDAFDPRLVPELYDSVRTRRIFAFLIDVVLISMFTLVAAVFVFVLGIVTLGLGWLLFPLLWPGIAILYHLLVFVGGGSATPGMRLMGLQIRLWYGPRIYALLGLMHAILFYVSVTFLTPFVLLFGLVSDRKRLLHDLVLGTVVVDSRIASRIA